MTGYRRADMGGWHLRVVEDASDALAYLAQTWGSLLPDGFYAWLRAEVPGSTYRLTQGVYEPELWVTPDDASLAVLEPVPAGLRASGGD